MGTPAEWELQISVSPSWQPGPEPPAKSMRARPVPSADPGPSAKVVMVVEDDAAIREMLVRSLGLEYRVYEAHDGQMALDMLNEMKEPDLMLLDVMMPNMDGHELASKLKAEKRFKTVPIVFLTGLDSPKDVVKGINVGARHYVTKPFKIQDLLGKVAKAITTNKK
jgi:DNA-binding response OmpR family regulator